MQSPVGVRIAHRSDINRIGIRYPLALDPILVRAIIGEMAVSIMEAGSAQCQRSCARNTAVHARTCTRARAYAKLIKSLAEIRTGERAR